MNDLQLAIIKNKNFYDLVNELDFDCIFFEENNNTPSKIIIPGYLIVYDESSKNILSASSMNFDNKNKICIYIKYDYP